MKKSLCILLTFFLALVMLCSCSDTASDISVSEFERKVINKIPGDGNFSKKETDKETAFINGNIKYKLENTQDGYIKKLTVTVSGADKDYFKKLNYSEIESPSSDLTDAQRQSILAVNYCAMPLKLICNMQDEDCIDTVLDARTMQVKENSWTFSVDTSKKAIVFTARYRE